MFSILESLNELKSIEDKVTKLSEVFESHAQLNPDLFDEEDQLKDDIRIQLVKIADTFVESIQDDNIPIHVIDYWLLGSNAQYNYSKTSDIDIHVIVDTEVDDCTIAPYLLNLLYDYVKSNFNRKYDITVKGYSVELYLEDVKSGAVTNGIYSLKKDEWIKKPDRVDPRSYDITQTKIWKDTFGKYESLKDEECEEFLDDLHVMRKISLATEGEWGDGNLVFKEFRNRGYIKDLKDRKYKVRSKELTLEKLLREELLTEATTPPYRKILLELLAEFSTVDALTALIHSGQKLNIHHIDGKYEEYTTGSGSTRIRAINNNPNNILIMSQKDHKQLPSRKEDGSNDALIAARVQELIKNERAFNIFDCLSGKAPQILKINTNSGDEL